MRAVVLKEFNSSLLTVEDIPTPELKRGQVLVKLAAAPVNPSDLIFLRNQYGVKKEPPVVPGFEGSGAVVASNAGLYGRWLVGKRVACRAPEDGNGTWAEYMATDSKSVVPLLRGVTLEQGASLLVNPLTAWALLSMARKEHHHGFVQTAAASALGQMIERLARRWQMVSINIVRRREQVELLKKNGAVHVLDSSATGFEEQLHVLSERHKIRLAFDAVGGDLTSRVASAMPKGSKVVVYGALAGENCQMSPLSLIFEDKKLEGFWLSDWIKKIGFLRKLKMATGAQKLLATDLATHVQARFPLEKIQDAIALYKEKRIVGKVLLIPTPLASSSIYQ
jgi:NADPH:quinone reductase-like Zn-dependent oxidoreductase